MPESLSNIDPSAILHQYVIPWAINIALALVVFVVGRLVVGLIVKMLGAVLRRAKVAPILSNFLCSIAKAMMLLVVIIAALHQLGIDTTSLIALIGAAGLAVGLALQDSLKNFAAGVLLILFRPFKTGDFVELANTAGTVEEINVFSTRLRTGDNRAVLVPNGAIYSGTITNYSANPTRRIDLVFGIAYGDDLRRAKSVIEEILGADERILKDPAPQVAVGELSDASVDINVRPWVNNADYWTVRSDLLERIMLGLEGAGLTIPYPQLDVNLRRA
ncbi:MAG: mechanosensitive ion channel [Chromatiales bacterium]|nr:mechanosensitive ion channel [Chromatiales bacterium]